MPKALDLILLGRPGVESNGFESFGELVIQLDDGAFENVSGKMHSMTNQAAAGKSTTWTAQSGDYVLLPDVQGSGRTAFSRFAVVGQIMLTDVLEDGFTSGCTFGCAFKFVDDDVDMLTNTAAPNAGGHFGVRSFNAYSAIMKAGSDTAISDAAAAIANVWHVGVFVLDTTRTLCLIDGVDLTVASPDIWDGITPAFFRFDRGMFAGTNSERADYLGLYAYNGGLDNTNINKLGQKMADDFGFTQTWSFSG